MVKNDQSKDSQTEMTNLGQAKNNYCLYSNSSQLVIGICINFPEFFKVSKSWASQRAAKTEKAPNNLQKGTRRSVWLFGCMLSLGFKGTWFKSQWGIYVSSFILCDDLMIANNLQIK